MNGINAPGHTATGQNVPGRQMAGQNHDHGRCMVAIVRGLRDARLAVTVTDNRGFEALSRRCVSVTAASQNRDPCLPPKKSSCTQTRSHQQRASQHSLRRAIEDQHQNSYQAAHCMLSSHSGPIRPECTVPRIEPIAARSHNDQLRPRFESFLPVRDTNGYRYDAPWLDRGIEPSMPCYLQDSFAASLRKYPMTPVERSTSVDLLHRLLAYGHTRNLPKSSYHSKSLRSLRHSQEPTRDLQNLARKDSKNIQTYTRAHNDSSRERNSERESDNARKRKRYSNSPVHDLSDISSRNEDEISSYSYDYLKPPHRTARSKVRQTGQGQRSSHHCVGSNDMHALGVEETNLTSPVHPETSTRDSHMAAAIRSYNICMEPPSRSSTPRGSPVRLAMTPRESVLRTEKNTLNSLRIRLETSPRSSPMRTESSPRSSPVRLETSPRSSPVRLETSPRSSPVRLETSPRSSPVRLETSPRSSPVRLETSPRSSPVRLETSPCSSPVRKDGRATRDRYRHLNKTEVRYLNDLTRNVREAIRLIYDDQPQPCPHISSRYHQHKREFHRSEPAVSDWTHMESQTSPGPSQDRASHSRSASVNVSPKCSPTSKPCNICHKLLPCGCSKSAKKLRFNSPNLCTNISDPCNNCDDNIEEEISDRDYVNLQIEDVIYNWLQDIPVYAHYSPSDRCQRERIISTLINAIKGYYGSENFENLAREEISKCLCELPMWYPNNKDKDEFRGENTEKLIRKLRVVNSKRDKFGEIVAKWFKQLCFRTTQNGQPVEQQKILTELTKNLRRVALKEHATEEEYYNSLKEEAYEIVDKLPLAVEQNRIKINRTLTDDLVNRLAEIPLKEVKKILDYEPQNDYEREILEWVEDLPEFINLTEEEGKQAIKRLATKLKQLRSQGLKYEEVHDQMGVAINDWIRSLQERQPVDLELELQQDILSWVELVAELDPSCQSENENFSKNLAEQLNTLQMEEFENETIQDQILSQIKSALNRELERKHKKLDVKNKNLLAIHLLERIENTFERQKKKQQLPRLLRKKVEKWLNEIPRLVSKNLTEKQELEQITQVLVNNLYQLQKVGVNENIQNKMLEEIKNVYDFIHTKRSIQFTPKQKEKSCDKLLNKVLKLINNIENDYLPEKQLQDNIQKEMMNVIEKVFQYSRMSPARKNEIANFVHYTAKHMTLIAIEGIQDEHVQQAMSEEIKLLLNQINEIKHTVTDENKNNEIADSLLKNVVTAIHKTEKKTRLVLEYEKGIATWLNSIDELSKSDKDSLENERVSNKLAKKLIELQANGIDDELIRDQMKYEIQKHLEQTLDKRGKSLSPRAINKYVENLMLQLTKLTQNAAAVKIATKERQEEFEKDIAAWLDDIPQLAGHSPEDKANNLRLSESLAKNLNRWHHEGIENDGTRDQMLKEIKSYMDLGAEIRGQHVIDPRDKEELAEQLLDKIVFKSEFIDSKDNISAKIQKEIDKWIKNIPELKDSSSAGTKQIEFMVQQLTSQIIELQSMKMDDEELKIASINLIITALAEFLEKKGENMNTEAKQNLAESLFENIVSATKKAELGQIPSRKMQKEVQRDINDWLEGIPEAEIKTPDEKKDTQNIVKRMTTNLLNLRSDGINDDQIQHKMLNDIEEELIMYLEKRGKRLNSKEKHDFAENLYDEVITTADKNEKKLKMPNVIKNDVLEWIENIPELKSSSLFKKTQNEQWAGSFAKILQNILEKYAVAKELHNQCLKITKAELELALEKRGQQLGSNTKNQVVENLVDKIIKRKQQMENSSVPTKAVEKEIKEDIEVWLYDIPQIPLGKQRDEFVQKLAKDINKLPVGAIHDEKVQKQIFHKINANLENELSKNGSDMTEEQKTQLTEELLATLVISGDVAFKKHKLANTDIQKNIEYLIDEIPELTSTKPSEKKDNEEMCHKLAKKLYNLQAMGFNGKTSHDQMTKDIKNELNYSLDKKGETLSPVTKNKLAENLVENISKSVEKSEFIQAPNKTIEKVFQKEILEWMEAVSELASKGINDKKDNEEFAMELSQNLTELYAAGIDHNTLREIMLEVIKHYLETVLESKDECMNANNKDILAYTLLNNLVGALETEKFKVIEKHVNDKVKRDIKNCIEDNEELNTADIYEKQNLLKSIEQTLKNFRTQDINDFEVYEDTINEIKEHLESSAGKKMLHDPKKTALAEKLLDQASKTISKYGKRHIMTQIIFKKNMEWFEGIPETAPSSTTEQKQLENISRVLAQKITVLFAKDIESEEIRCQVLVEIKDSLDHILEKRGYQIEPFKKKQLCEELLNSLVTSLERTGSKPKILDEISKQELKSEMTDWILDNPDLPFDISDMNDIEGFNEIIANKINKMLAEGVPLAEIKSKIVPDIIKELDKLCEKKGIRLDPIKKKRIVENLFDSISKKMKKNQNIIAVQSTNARTLSPIPEEELKNEITNCILNDPDLPFDKSDLKDIENFSDKLAKKINKLRAKGIPDEIIKSEIMKDINNELDKKGIQLDPKQKNKIAETLYNKIARFVKDSTYKFN